MENLLFVTGEEGDWEGLYVKGKLVKEGHELTKYDVLDALKEYNFDLGFEYGEYTINQEYLDDYGLSIYFKKIDESMLTKNT